MLYRVTEEQTIHRIWEHYVEAADEYEATTRCNDGLADRSVICEEYLLDSEPYLVEAIKEEGTEK